jgi:type IV secretory pathway protease TraF
LPRGVPLLKRVLALPGQTVCRNYLAVMIDGVVMSFARERDHRGRPLPVWQGCQLIAEGQVFLMNLQSADSLDGPDAGAFGDETLARKLLVGVQFSSDRVRRSTL